MASPASNLPTIFKLIQEAQSEDVGGNERAAYYHYLVAVQQMAGVLQSCSPDQGQSVVPPDKTRKLFGMLKQSLEQAEDLFVTALEEKRSFKEPPKPRPSTNTQERTAVHSPAVAQRTLSSNVPQRAPSGSSSVPYRSHSMSQKQLINPLHRLSPMEGAKRRNTHLMSQYQANLKQRSSAILGDRRQNLSLNYLRRREENLCVARITEQAISNKLRSREIRIQEEQQRAKHQKSLDLLSLEQLVESITQFEQGKPRLTTLKQHLTSSPSSSECVCNLIAEVLSMSDHPIAKLFGERQFQVTQLLTSLASTIQKSGGLPRLEITQDDPGLLSPTGHPRSYSASEPGPQTTHYQQPFSASLPPSSPERRKTQDNNQSATTPHPSAVLPSEDSLEQRLAALKSHFDDDEESNSSCDLSSVPSTGELERLVDQKQENIEPDEKNVSSDKASESVDSDDKEVEKEVEEEVVFRGLVLLKCNLHLGNDEVMVPLSEKAAYHLKEAVKMIHASLNKLVHVCATIYPEMSSSDNKEVAGVFLEAHFFPALMEHLRPIYRCANYSTECAVAKNMCKYVNATPRDLSVRKKFLLNNQDIPPYSPASMKLQTIQTLSCPAPKLDCLVSLSKAIIQCIEEYYESLGADRSTIDTSVGVDDILPILSYIIIRSGLPMLVSESALMQEFIPESYAMGEEGFCLTTFHTALQFVAQMSS